MKKHLFIFSLFLLSISLIGCSKRESVFSTNPENYIDQSSILKGKISGLLTLEHSPYRVMGKIEVDSLSTLTIEPGVSLYFSDSSGLIVRGKLVAQGKQGEPVTFTPDKDMTHWHGIQFVHSRDTSLLSFAIIEKISITMNDIEDIGAVTMDYSSVTIRNSIVRNNSSPEGGGIYSRNSRCEITNSVFMNNQAGIFGGAVLAYSSDLVFINNTVYKNSTQNYGGGLVIWEPSSSLVENNIFYYNYGRTGTPGIAVKGESSKSVIKYNYEAFGINTPPRFLSETNLHLSENSPCINNGDPNPTFNDLDNSRNDQGAYGGPMGNW
ncbi:MAG: right-handed parallel beta-helix repeat-containing protein [Acidobacteriota bacterium]